MWHGEHGEKPRLCTGKRALKCPLFNSLQKPLQLAVQNEIFYFIAFDTDIFEVLVIQRVKLPDGLPLGHLTLECTD